MAASSSMSSKLIEEVNKKLELAEGLLEKKEIEKQIRFRFEEFKTLSKELPPSITINNVLPGFTNTERLTELKKTLSVQKGITQDEVEKAWLSTVPEGRLAEPSELGTVIAFLSSPAASFVRGTSIPVDGGRTGSI